MTILLIEPQKPPRTHDIPSDLPSMQSLVGGTIQAVYPFDEPIALICHEEGKLLGLPLNRVLRHPETDEVYDIVAGTFFLCGAPPDSEHFESLNEDQVRRYMELFRAPEQFIRLDNTILCVKED